MAYTYSCTYSRYSLLILQVETILLEAGEVSNNTLSKIKKGLAEPHYITEVAVRAFFSRTGKLGVEMRITIDWRRHELIIQTSGANIEVPSNWIANKSPSLSAAIRTFNNACEYANLEKECVVVYDSKFDRDEVNRYLGFCPAEHREWNRTPDRLSIGLGNLEEANVVISMAID